MERTSICTGSRCLIQSPQNSEALRSSEMSVTSENATPDSGGVSQAKCRCTKYSTQGHLQIMYKRDFIRSINNLFSLNHVSKILHYSYANIPNQKHFQSPK